MASIAQALSAARSTGLERLDSQLLLLHALGTPAAELSTRRSWLLAHDAEPLPPQALERFELAVQRRLRGEPLAYITGHKEFFGLDLLVDRRVLVPRPDTEILVGWAIEVLASSAPDPSPAGLQVLDLGTGSGAVALAIKQARPGLAVDAVDISADALAVARSNAARLRLDLRLVQGSWFDPVPGRYHCIVSNPPYVEQDDPHLPALRHEPAQALVSGADGLRDLHQIIGAAAGHLQPGGWLLLEHGFAQGPAVRALLLDAGFRNVSARRDLGGQWRCSGGQAPAPDRSETGTPPAGAPGR